MLPAPALHIGLIGEKLSHSFSKSYFEKKFLSEQLFGCSYDLFELPSLGGLRTLVMQHCLDGFNVTIPYKEQIIPLLDHIDHTAAQIGAVNTVKVVRDNDGSVALHGFNTDAPAFLKTIQTEPLPDHRKALILGTGGASKAVQWAFRQLGNEFILVSRNPELHPGSIGYNQLGHIDLSQFYIIVNATPVGMYPNVDATPLDVIHAFKHLSDNAFVYDLIYNPSPTRLLREAAACGAETKDGLEMLHLQAELSWVLFQQC